MNGPLIQFCTIQDWHVQNALIRALTMLQIRRCGLKVIIIALKIHLENLSLRTPCLHFSFLGGELLRRPQGCHHGKIPGDEERLPRHSHLLLPRHLQNFAVHS